MGFQAFRSLVSGRFYSQKSCGGSKRRGRAFSALLGAVAVIDCTSRLHATTQTSTWVGATSSNWSNSANWNPSNTDPNNGNDSISDFDVIVNSVTTPDVAPLLDTTVTIDALTLNTGATLGILGNNSMTVTGNVVDKGIITINSNQSYPSSLTLDGTLSGGGTVTLDNGSNATLAGPFTQSSGNTINGYGQISGALTNNGLVNANVASNSINVEGASATNSATMEATTGALVFSNGVSVGNAGGLIDAVGSNVTLSSATITGGTLSASSPNVILVQGATFSGPTISANSTVDVQGNYNLTLIGSTLTNNGSIQLNYNASYPSTLQVDSNLLLTGSGSVTLDNSGAAAVIATGTGDTLTQDVSHTINGTGEITATFVNDGTVDANSSAGLTLLTSNMTNNKLMEATAGGVLSINGISITQGTNGQIAVAANSTVDIDGATITDGTLNGTGNGIIQTVSGTNSTLASLTNNATLNIVGNSNLSVTGNLDNTGTITVNSNSSYPATLTFGGGTLSGGGTVTLDNSGTNADLAGTVTQASGNTINGYGQITGTVTNNGTIDASVSGQSIVVSSATMTNNNLLEATGGATLNLQSVAVTNTTGTITANASTVDLNGATITGGTLTSPSSGVIQTITQTTSTLSGVTNKATLNIVGNSTVNISGNLVNTGTVTVNSNNSYPAVLSFSGGTLSGAGTVTLDNGINGTLAGTLTQASGSTINGQGQITAALTNNGLVNANGAGNALTIDGTSVTNTSTIEATTGPLVFNNGVAVNNAGGLIDAVGSNITLNSASITGGTLTATSPNVFLVQGATFSGSTISTGTTVDVEGNYNLTLTGSTLTNNGNIQLNYNVSYPSTLQVNSNLLLTGSGSVTLDNSAASAVIATGTGDTLTQDVNHTINGTGEITATFINNGTVNANNASGLTILNNTVTNNKTIEATGTGNLGLQGVTLTQGVSGQINAAGGTVQLNGSASISQGTLGSSSGGIILNNSGSNSIGGLTNNATLDIAGNTTLAVSSAIVNNGAITVNYNSSYPATLNVNGAITGTGSLSIVNSGLIAFAKNIGANSQKSLSIAGTGTLDLNNNHLIINYGSGPDPIASIAAWIADGAYGGGTTVTWTGTGITSSAAHVNPSYGIGYADYADPGNPAGLVSGQIEIAYTLLGDANLDDKVNGTDFNLMATNFNQAVTAGWDKGDFNYDNKVNGNDFVLLAANFNQFASQSDVSQADLAALDSFAVANGISLTSVPEPASGAIVAVAGFGILRRRRRSRG